MKEGERERSGKSEYEGRKDKKRRGEEKTRRADQVPGRPRDRPQEWGVNNGRHARVAWWLWLPGARCYGAFVLVYLIVIILMNVVIFY